MEHMKVLLISTKRNIYGMVKIIYKSITMSLIDTIDADDSNSRGYYIIEFNSVPYTLQENAIIDVRLLESSEIFANWIHFSPVIANFI